MNDIQASLGISQSAMLKKWINKRNNIAKYYKKKINSKNISFQALEKDVVSSYHLFVILIKNTKMNRDNVYQYLQKKKIFCNVHYIPIYRHPYYRNLGFKLNSFKNCEKYYKQTLTLPIYPSLKKSDQNKIIKHLNLILK